MIAFALQTVALLIVAFVGGCFLGSLARGLHARRSVPVPAQSGQLPAASRPTRPRTGKRTRSADTPRKPAAASPNDDLKLLSGVGSKLEQKPNRAGVTSFAQIARWTREDIASFDERLNFRGRIEREKWVEQAKALAAGRETDFSRRGKK